MRIIRPAEYRVMPWKNGGGETTEILVSPNGMSAFDWRVSIALVNEDGPFSFFAGYERHIMVLSGEGMSLDVERRGKFDLEPYHPFSFSGDAAVNGSLLRGRVRDFNLMVKRNFGIGTLRVVACRAGQKIGSEKSLQLIHVLQGRCEAGNYRLHPNDSICLEAGEGVSFSSPLKLAVCEITPHLQPAPGV